MDTVQPETVDVPKRRVTMRNAIVIGFDTQDRPVLQDHIATDYVPEDILEQYVADARTRWQQVLVSDDVDAGPGGTSGDTVIPDAITPEA